MLFIQPGSKNLIFAGMLLCLLLSSASTVAQPADQPETGLKYWIQGGSSLTTLGPGVQAGFNIEYNRHLFSLRTISTDPTFGKETWEAALLYGRSISIRSFYLSAGVGASAVGGSSYSRLFGSDEEAQMDTMLGFPLEGQISWTPARFVALGIYSFANVNTGQPLGGIGLSLRLGNLR